MTEIAEQTVSTAVDAADASSVHDEPRRSVSLSLVLAGSFGLLVLVAVSIVLAIMLTSSRTTLLTLQGEVVELLVTGLKHRVQTHLQPAEQQARYVAEQIATAAYDPADGSRLTDLLNGALAAAPQVDSIMYVDRDYRMVGVNRAHDISKPFTEDAGDDPRIVGGVNAARQRHEGFWAAPIYWREAGGTYLNLRQPVHRGEEFLGIVVAVVSIAELSRYLDEARQAADATAFVLYGHDRVLAHWLLAGPQDNLSEANPLPRLASFGDPVLGSIWTAEKAFDLRIKMSPGIEGKAVDLSDREYIYIFTELPGFGPEPLIVGSYFRTEDVDEAFRRFAIAAVSGFAVLLIAVIAAVLLARRIVRPIARLADAAGHIGKLEFAEVGELPSSRFRELDEQSVAFNSMLRGLRWFEIYVPRALVQRLLRQVEAGTLKSEEREVTVMFTDIAGFTRQSEGEPASRVAEFLNRHFAMVAAAVEAEGGTVDKFIGDAVMAFWGAPESQPDHARRAARAARAIADALRTENQARQKEGRTPIRMRIGLHSGPVTVGNIGSPGRINYTIVGDTVNIGQRLEQLGKRVAGEAEVVILASAATAAELEPGMAEPSGAYAIDGLSAELAVYRLDGPPKA